MTTAWKTITCALVMPTATQPHTAHTLGSMGGCDHRQATFHSVHDFCGNTRSVEYGGNHDTGLRKVWVQVAH